MKKVLLLIISLFFALSAFAYETVLVDFPTDEGWHGVYYRTIRNEAILQYVPRGETAENWTRTLVFHSYKNVSNNASGFLGRTTMQMEAQNASQLYKYIKRSEVDSIATRCIEKNALIPAQCEIYRVSKSFEGLISMHYINKNISDFKNTYDLWYKIVKNIRIYQSYYRLDRIMDKATSFEL